MGKFKGRESDTLFRYKRRRQAVILLILAVVILGAVFVFWVIYRLNPSRFSSWVGTLFIIFAGLGVLIGIIGAAFADLFLPLWDRLETSEPTIRPRLREDAPIKRINYETLVSRLGRSGRIPWINRGAISTRELRLHGRVAIVGLMKSGKTREAVELIRAALAEDMITAVYEPTSALDLIDRDLLNTAIIAEVDERERSLFFIDELGIRPEKERLDRLSTCIQDISQVRPDTYLAITIQRERLTSKFAKWLATHEFHVIELPVLSLDQRQELARTSSEMLDVNITEDAVEVLTNQTDGRPYSIIFALQQTTGAQIVGENQIASGNLRELLVNHFSVSELQTLCFDLRIDYDDIPGRDKREKAREIVSYVGRRLQTTNLIQLIRERRPKLSWDKIVSEDRESHSLVNADDIRQLLTRSDEEAWAEQRRQIVTSNADAGAILESIATFISAGVTLRESNIHRYATYLIGSNYSSEKVRRQLELAAKRWAIFDIVAVQGLYTIPEPLVLPLLFSFDEARGKLVPGFINP
ncbi:MAG: hypothetical protein KC421_13325, partial [Anaerolineales bacterium]|nr:hypothetical protein [Anaerolineales bacterium]